MIDFLLTFIAIVLDVITGSVKALFTTGFNSSIMRKGGMHKLGEVFALIFALFVDYALSYFKIDIGVNVTRLTCIYILVMECISIIENIGLLNENAIPKQIKKIFEKLNKEVNE